MFRDYGQGKVTKGIQLMDIRQIGQLSIPPASIEFPQIELIPSELVIPSIEIDDPFKNPDWCDQGDECWYPMCGCHVKP